MTSIGPVGISPDPGLSLHFTTPPRVFWGVPLKIGPEVATLAVSRRWHFCAHGGSAQVTMPVASVSALSVYFHWDW